MQVLLGVLLGWAVVGSVLIAGRLAPRSLFLGQGRAMQSALHAATVILPDLRRGLTVESARRAAPHLRALTQAAAIALADRTHILAFDGRAAEHHGSGEGIFDLVAEGRDDRVHMEAHFKCTTADCPLGAAIVAPLIVASERVGSLIAFYRSAERLTPDDIYVIGEAASLVSAQIELSELDAQGERLARAELRALRAQISPHFIYNALAAVAGYIHSSPEVARERLTDFSQFIRYAFRSQRPFVALSDELEYVRTYLRLEQARFGDRLHVDLEVEPGVLDTLVPVLSVQPLVENAVRHGIERRAGAGWVRVIGRAHGECVCLQVIDDGAGMTAEHARASLSGMSPEDEREHLGMANVQGRLQASFGQGFGLNVESSPGRGTTVTMTLPRLSERQAG